MALSFAALQVSASLALSLNADHAQVGALFPHNDGPEFSGSPPVASILSGSAPTTATQAWALMTAAVALLNTHFGMADGVNGDHIFAHNIVDGANIITGTMPSWSSVEATLLSTCFTLLNDLAAKYEAHRLNSGGVFHTTVDTVNYLGGPLLPGGATPQMMVERANLLAGLLSDHVIKEGGTHSAPDGGDVVSAANAVYDPTLGTDWDKMITLVAQLQTKLNAHEGNGVHALADAVNTSAAALVALPGGWNALAAEIKTKFEAHRILLPQHNFVDSTDTLTYSSPPTTVAGMIAAGVQVFNAVNGHIQAAPISRAYRSS